LSKKCSRYTVWLSTFTELRALKWTKILYDTVRC